MSTARACVDNNLRHSFEELRTYALPHDNVSSLNVETKFILDPYLCHLCPFEK